MQIFISFEQNIFFTNHINEKKSYGRHLHRRNREDLTPLILKLVLPELYNIISVLLSINHLISNTMGYQVVRRSSRVVVNYIEGVASLVENRNRLKIVK